LTLSLLSKTQKREKRLLLFLTLLRRRQTKRQWGVQVAASTRVAELMAVVVVADLVRDVAVLVCDLWLIVVRCGETW
jgi:hypothetical protein